METYAGFLMHVNFEDNVDIIPGDILFDEKTFLEEKTEFRWALLETLSELWFLENESNFGSDSTQRGIPSQLYHTERHECQVRNMFNRRKKIPTDKSCYSHQTLFESWKKSNFIASCGIQESD